MRGTGVLNVIFNLPNCFKRFMIVWWLMRCEVYKMYFLTTITPTYKTLWRKECLVRAPQAGSLELIKLYLVLVLLNRSQSAQYAYTTIDIHNHENSSVCSRDDCHPAILSGDGVRKECSSTIRLCSIWGNCICVSFVFSPRKNIWPTKNISGTTVMSVWEATWWWCLWEQLSSCFTDDQCLEVKYSSVYHFINIF